MNNNIFKYKDNIYVINGGIKNIKDDDIVFDPNIKNLKVFYNGTKKEWAHVNKEGPILDVPCIKCKDGDYIQKL